MRSDLGCLNKDNFTWMGTGSGWLRWSGLRGWGARVEEVWISDRNEGLCNIKKEKKTEREFDTLKLNFIFVHI